MIKALLLRSIGLATLLLAGSAAAGEFVVTPERVVDRKTVYGRVETRDVVPARARIGGTLLTLDVAAGSAVTAGQTLAIVGDAKLGLQLQALDARIAALQAEASNARSELERASALVSRGITTPQRVEQLRTQSDVATNQITAAQAERAVVVQQASEGAVLAPISGRVLTAPLTRAAVVMPGETIARIGGGGVFLRLALPERHAATLKVGATVEVDDSLRLPGAPRQGTLVKLYPQIENGRVIADIDVPGLSDDFVDERVLVRVPVAEREVLTVPVAAIATRSGLDFVTVVQDAGGSREVLVVPGEVVADGERVEILSGLRAGDRVVTP